MPLLYEGKVKKIYRHGESELIQEFKNAATAFNGVKKEEISGKGELNSKICALIYKFLNEQGVPTHFLEYLPPNRIRTTELKMIPIEVVIRNRVAGSLAKRLGEDEGRKLDEVLVEWFYKDDSAGDPQVSESDLETTYKIPKKHIEEMRRLALFVNTQLLDFFGKRNLDLIDFKLEFGLNPSGEVILGDEISPDSCRIWDSNTAEKLDKDRFRFDLGDLVEGYQEILKRLESK